MLHEQVDLFPAREGQFVNVKGKSYVIARPDPYDGWIAHPTDGGQEVQLGNRELAFYWKRGDLTIADEDQNKLPKPLQKTLNRVLSSFTSKERMQIEYRLSYVRSVSEKLSLHKRTQKRIDAICKDIAAELGHEKPPYFKTVKSWLLRWEGSKDPRSLLPSHHGKGNRKPRISGVANAAISHGIYHLLDDRQQQTQDGYKAAIDYAKQHYPGDAMQLFSIQTFYKHYQKFDDRVKVRFREGQRTARSNAHAAGTGVDYCFPLERVEMDWTKSGVILVDEIHRAPLGNPWICIGICCYTRMITGYYVGFEPPSWASAAQCIKMCVSPKQQWIDLLNEQQPLGDMQIRKTWPIQGPPKSVWLDNDRTWLSESMRETCRMINTDIDLLPSYCPHLKGVIERFNRTLTQGLFDRVPGARLKTKLPTQPEYNAMAEAVMTLTQFNFLITKWIVDIYHQDDHQGFLQ